MMLFDDGDAALLKKWIVKRLEDMYVLLFSPSPLLPSPPLPLSSKSSSFSSGRRRE